ncbi:replication protein [Deinococcus grandis]|uniref:Replication protein n=1 Tax=Deinococcus grandis TaxID=57498 RepID=A0A100HNK6_9DEIO|nr:replication protein [Deinococcus grandis]
MNHLKQVIEAARAAVLGRADIAHPDRVGDVVTRVEAGGSLNNTVHDETFGKYLEVTNSITILDSFCGTGGFLKGDRGEPVQRPAAPPAPTVRVSAPALTPEGPSRPSCAPVGELVAGLDVSAGAARVFGVLHAVAGHVAQARSYASMPDTVTLHLPQGLLAVAAGYTPRHVRNLLPELVAAGLLDWGAHAVKVKGMGLWGGCLFAVKVKVGEVLPRLKRDDWRHQWRNLEADIEAGHTVKAVLAAISHLPADERESAVESALKAWAVSPGNALNPVVYKGEVAHAEGVGVVQDVRDIVYRLGDLVHVHPTKRAERVGRLASALSRALGDTHSRRFYCAVLWQAWRGEIEGRGTLQTLCAALLRLEADRQEWVGLRNPGALLVARLRAA